jgi:hypothetical protein
VLSAVIGGSAVAIADCEPDSPRAIIDSMLNLDVYGTDEKIARLEARDPNHPLLDFLKAMAILNRAYTTTTIDRSVEEQALVPLIEAVKKARARIQGGDDDPQVQLALGLSQAFVGSIYFAHDKSLKAYKYASAGHTTLENLVAEHPEIEDALLGLGLFNYYLGSIESKGMKWGAKMMGLVGDRDLGLSYLEQAAQSAPNVAPVAARVLLMEVDMPDEEKCKYSSLAQEMRNRYPGNRIFDLIARIIPLQCRLAESEGVSVYPDSGMSLASSCGDSGYGSTAVTGTYSGMDTATTGSVVNEVPADRGYYSSSTVEIAPASQPSSSGDNFVLDY